MHVVDRRRSRRRAHARAQGLLPDYLDDVLPRRQRLRVERHVLACPECRRAVVSVPSSLRMLRSLEAQTPPGLVRGILDRLHDAAAATGDVTDAAHGAGSASPRRSSLAAPGGAHRRALSARTRDVAAYCLTPADLLRSIPIALVIGIGLTMVYQLHDFMHGSADAGAYVMCACNFVVPFVLVSAGLVMARAAPRRRRR